MSTPRVVLLDQFKSKPTESGKYASYVIKLVSFCLMFYQK